MNPTNKKTQINVQLVLDLSILLFSIIAILQYITRDKIADVAFAENIMFVVISICIFLLIYTIWMLAQRAQKSNSPFFRTISVYFFLLISAGTILVTGGYQSNYKYLLLFSIMTATLEGNIKLGFIVSGISSAFLLALDVIFYQASDVNVTTNPYFENDMIMCGLFFILTYIIGYCIATKQQHINRLQSLVSVDELTGLYNFRYFQEFSDKAVLEAQRTGNPLSLLIMDLDWFKSYNDIHGHEQGNLVLQQTGELILGEFPDKYLCARYGGEEFVVLMPDTTIDAALEIAERFRVVFEETPFYGENLLPHGRLTISIGVADLLPNMKKAKELISNADDALYRAKFLRRNRTEKYVSFAAEFVKITVGQNQSHIVHSVETLIAVIDAKDKYTYMHSDRVTRFCKHFGNYLGLPESDLRLLITAAYMHDIGKVNISSSLLLKSDKLTDEEFSELKSHPDTGADIVSGMTGMTEIGTIIRQHHERYDGTGYPANLSGENIHYLARILTLADSFDAMTAKRPYKSNVMTWDEAVAEILRYAGAQFDPELASKFADFITTVS